MALSLDVSLEEVASWIVSEEEMAEFLIEMNLIDETAYRSSKMLEKTSGKLDNFHNKSYSKSNSRIIDNKYNGNYDFKNKKNLSYKNNIKTIKEDIIYDRVA